MNGADIKSCISIRKIAEAAGTWVWQDISRGAGCRGQGSGGSLAMLDRRKNLFIKQKNMKQPLH